MDYNIGLIFDALETYDFENNMCIIITSDNDRECQMK